MSNNIDPDETAHYEPSHLDLRCLQKPISDYGSERVKLYKISRPITYESTDAVAKLLEHPPCIWEVVCLIPGQPIPKNLNTILLWLLFHLVA